MKTKTLVRSLAFVAALLAGSAVMLPASEPARQDAAISGKLIAAVAKSDYDAFVADGDARFKQMQKDKFMEVAAHLAPRFQAGYEATYLGELNQKGARVTLWKLTFKDHGDDALVTLTVNKGKVAGFWIK